jgi:hypothetical protein
MNSDKVVEEIDWLAITKYVTKDPNERLWLSLFSITVKDWAKFKSNPCRHTWRNARDLVDWPNSLTFEIVSGLINHLTGMSEDLFKKKFVEWMGVVPVINVVDDLIVSVAEPNTEVYVCNICDDKVNEIDLRDHLGEHNPNGYNVDNPLDFYTKIYGGHNG